MRFAKNLEYRNTHMGAQKRTSRYVSNPSPFIISNGQLRRI